MLRTVLKNVCSLPPSSSPLSILVVVVVVVALVEKTRNLMEHGCSGRGVLVAMEIADSGEHH